jgi:hypothetical protein
MGDYITAIWVLDVLTVNHRARALSVLPHMSHRAGRRYCLLGPDRPFYSGSPSSGAKGPRRRRSNQCLYALMGCRSERSRS